MLERNIVLLGGKIHAPIIRKEINAVPLDLSVRNEF